MAVKSDIEWTDGTWNPVRGCTRVSPGCGGPGPHGGCYAEIMAARFSKPGQWGHGFAEMKNGDHRWTGKVALIESQLALPLRWKRPRKIFVNSTSDLFHEKLSDEQIDLVFAVMALCPQHTFQVLTKRPERMRSYFNGPYPNGDGVFARIAEATFEFVDVKALSSRSMVAERPIGPALADGEPEFGYRRFLPIGGLPHVWLGTSVEDQERADERIPHLLATEAAVRFVSCEPLLGSIDLRKYLDGHEEHGIDMSRDVGSRVGACIGWTPPLDWVICGGESGHGSRPMMIQWARDLRDQCAATDVPFFFKQWGEFRPDDPTANRTSMVRVGKGNAGRLLDGREHNGFPEAACPG